MSIFKEKQVVRKEIAEIKSCFTATELIEKSAFVIKRLEKTEVFMNAKSILIYNSMSDEVSTKEFLSRWKDEKTLYLPVIVGDKMVFRKYTSDDELKLSEYGINEPVGEDLKDFSNIDLMVIPGVAFDRDLNRLGRGKAYYDKFLRNLEVFKLAIAFDFQIVRQVPTSLTDIKMNMIITESGSIKESKAIS